jgi:plasmid stability protein
MAEETRAVYLRGIDPDTYRWLKIRAAHHERSMQAELRAIILDLKAAEESADNSAGAIFRKLREQYGTFEEFEIPSRTDSPERWVDFSE